MLNLTYDSERVLDTVNEDDEVISSSTRGEIHRLGLLHREVHVWMFDNNHFILFQKRALHRPQAGLFDATVGGHVNKDENYLGAVVRETKEETGISVLPSDLIFLKKFKGKSERGLSGTINNFIKAVYIYKKPVDKQIKEETGLPGVGFSKLSPEYINNIKKEEKKAFAQFILTEELPAVIEYLNKLP